MIDSEDALVTRLRAAGCVYAEDEARLLLAEARTLAELTELADRRVAGLPLEQVLGWAEFRGLRIVLEPGVFVPRVRTGFLVAEAIRHARAGAVVLDLCCGSGALGVAVAAAVEGVELYAADLDPAAIRCARRNVEPAGGAVFEGDLYEPLPAGLRGRVDVLLANVPYVPTGEVAMLPAEAREHEHRIALDGGADGLEVLRRVSAAAGEWLAPGGQLYTETSERQAPVAVGILAGAGLDARVATSEDLHATVVVGANG